MQHHSPANLHGSTRRSIAGGLLAGGLLAAGFLAVSATTEAQAQGLADFHTVDWFEREIGEGVVWRQFQFEELFGVRQTISYIEIDLDNPNVEVEIPHLTSGGQRTSVMVPNQYPNALGAVNGTYYSFNEPIGGGSSALRHNTYFRYDGSEVVGNPRSKGAWGHHGGLAQDTSDDWHLLSMPSGTAEWDQPPTEASDYPTLIANGPRLIVNGVIETASFALPSGNHCTGRHNRTAVGLTGDNRLLLVTIDGRTNRGIGTTCEETAIIMEELGAVDALNMDGGGTTTMWIAGEPSSGVVNYPSDPGGERSTPNAIAVVSTPAAPAEWDARLLSISYNPIMAPDDTQNVTLVYENIGTETWTQADTRLVTSRPTERNSDLHEGAWVSPSQPALMNEASVTTGNTATFTFPVTGPPTNSMLSFEEHFMLTQDGVGRIGPSDARARMVLQVVAETPDGEAPPFYIESRSGGQNHAWYGWEVGGFFNSTASTTASGTTPGIGMRWGSTWFDEVGLRQASWRPDFPESGLYHVAVAWPDGASSRRDPVGYYVNHSGGQDLVMINQDADGDVWYPLGIFHFNAGQSTNGQVTITNQYTNESGNLWVGPTRWILIESDDNYVPDWDMY